MGLTGESLSLLSLIDDFWVSRSTQYLLKGVRHKEAKKTEYKFYCFNATTARDKRGITPQVVQCKPMFIDNKNVRISLGYTGACSGMFPVFVSFTDLKLVVLWSRRFRRFIERGFTTKESGKMCSRPNRDITAAHGRKPALSYEPTKKDAPSCKRSVQLTHELKDPWLNF